jgi:hypothetical protein
MIINIILLCALFGAKKKTKNPYIPAILLGVIKAALYLFFSEKILPSLIIGGAFAVFASAFVYFLKRLDQPKAGETTKPLRVRSADDKMEFQWEYIPLTILLLILIGGEWLLA